MAKFRITRPGWVWLLIIAALLGIGLLRRINLLTLLVCLLLVLWCINALLAGWRLRRLRGKRRIESPVFAEAEFHVEAEVTNTRRAGRAAVRIEDLGPGHALAWFAARLPGRQTTTFRQKLTLSNRGHYAWGPLSAWSSYPFGLVRRGVRLVDEESLLVLPRLGRLHRGRLRQFLTRHVAATEPIRHAPRERLATEAEFHGLRTFRHGDSPRWIHWRTTARRGELMVREFEDAPGEHLILVVDPYLPADCGAARPSFQSAATVTARSSRLEDAISFAATVCWEWCRQPGNRFVLGIAAEQPVICDGATGRTHALTMLESLAIQQTTSGKRASDLVDQLSALPLPPAPVLLVSAHADRLGEALARQLNRPVVRIDPGSLDDLEFYDRPDSPRPGADMQRNADGGG
jgi:uncharacterized protein (DUF58 family)